MRGMKQTNEMGKVTKIRGIKSNCDCKKRQNNVPNKNGSYMSKNAERAIIEILFASEIKLFASIRKEKLYYTKALDKGIDNKVHRRRRWNSASKRLMTFRVYFETQGIYIDACNVNTLSCFYLKTDISNCFSESLLCFCSYNLT